jgi:hypothetical protein
MQLPSLPQDSATERLSMLAAVGRRSEPRLSFEVTSILAEGRT